MNATDQNQKGSIRHKVFTIIGIVLCVLLIPILIVNVTLIIKSYTGDGVPNFIGIFPQIVLTDSMKTDDPKNTIDGGDLIICHTIDAEEIKVGDIISFFDPEGNGTSVVTHRVIEVISENGTLAFCTQGDANITPDRVAVSAENLVGIYKFRIPYAGNVAMFMQTTAGLIVCVVLPMILLIGYDLARRKMYEKSKQQDTAALMAELEALKAEREKTQTPRTPSENEVGTEPTTLSGE